MLFYRVRIQLLFDETALHEVDCELIWYLIDNDENDDDGGRDEVDEYNDDHNSHGDNDDY